MTSGGQQPLFRPLGGEEGEEPEVTEIESLCMNCHANGITRLLLTRIPYYKNVVVMSFSCEECGYQNNELQPGGACAEKGILWTLNVEEPEDLNRQVVKSDYTTITIPELDFEIPARSQGGEVTTVEGILARAIAGLSQDQPARREDQPYEADQIDQFLLKLRELRDGKLPWTLELEDISGNCFIENPVAPRPDPRCVSAEYTRSDAANHRLGIYTNYDTPTESTDESEDDLLMEAALRNLALARAAPPAQPAQPAQPTPPAQPAQAEHLLSPSDPDECPYETLEADEVMQFRTNCPDCDSPCTTNMKMTNIPHFKEVIIMSTTCDYCGHRTNEVKSGGAIEEKGVRFEVRVANKDDFSRDILKSETCSLQIPELELEVGGRALGGRFTTAEGVLSATLQQLRDCPGVAGDAPAINSEALRSFVSKLEEVLLGQRAVTLLLDDPAGNSYVQSLALDPGQPDHGLKITRYERSFEQNEELGLNDLNVDDYQPSR